MKTQFTFSAPKWIARTLSLAMLGFGASAVADTNVIGSLDGTFETSLPAGTFTGDTSRVSNIVVLFKSNGVLSILMSIYYDVL